MSYCPGRLLLLGFALASPVDLALDVRMGVLLANIDATALLPVMLFSFLYLGLRLQVPAPERNPSRGSLRGDGSRRHRDRGRSYSEGAGSLRRRGCRVDSPW